MSAAAESSNVRPLAGKVTHTVVPVTPEIAKRWLAKNKKNRKIRQAVVQRYRTDMAADRWEFAGDPIRFDYFDNLIDGQHRLTALSELENASIPMLVIRGLPPEMQSVMDQGSRRTPGDQLGLKGIPQATTVAAAVKQYLIWEEGLLFRDAKLVIGSITTTRIEEWVDNNPVQLANFQKVITLTKQNDAPPRIAGAAAIRFMQVDPEAAVEFLTLLARGAGTQGHPIVTLDKRLASMRRAGVKIPDRDYLALFVTAWNAWRDGRQMAKFQRPKGGSYDDNNFPEPH